MKIESIRFGDDEPAEVTVTMTIAEAAAVTKVFGRLVPTPDVASGIYSVFTSMLFNAYWEDGVEEVSVPFDLPKRIALKAAEE